MKLRTLIFLLIGLSTCWVFAQKTHIYIDHSDKLLFNESKWPDCQILVGNVQFRHENMLMYCDSAYFYNLKNYIIATGNIKMNQADSVYVYGDILYYDGNTKLARLRHNVRMENNEATLYTDSLNFDRKINMGYYFNGGRIVDSTNVLVSVNGKYYPNKDLAIFQNQVVLTNPDFVLTSDTLHYNTNSDIATILGPSDIMYQDSTHIYSEKGWYNTKSNLSELTTNSYLNDFDGHYIKADTLYYDYNKRLAEGFSHVLMHDSAQHVIITGNYGWYNDSCRSALVTQIPTLLNYNQENTDTLYVTADTMLYADNDSLHYIKAYYNVQSWHKDFQSLCDSAYYSSADSTLRMYGAPIMWNDDNQFTGLEIYIHMVKQEIDHITLEQNGFIFSLEDSTLYNQVSGKQIIGYFADQKLYKAHVMGNALSVYFVKEDEEPADSAYIDTKEEKEYIGINRAESSDLMIYFSDDNRIKRLVMSPASNGVLHTPEKRYQTDITRLNGFYNYSAIRPKDAADIHTPKNKEALKAAQAAVKARKRRKALN